MRSFIIQTIIGLLMLAAVLAYIASKLPGAHKAQERGQFQVSRANTS
jgi:hypothetical protein